MGELSQIDQSWAARYLAAILQFARVGAEEDLIIAYEIGRAGIHREASFSDICEAHHRATAILLQEGVSPDQFLPRIEQFQLEIASIYDMALSGYQENLSHLSSEIKERRRIEEDLRLSTFELAKQKSMLEEEVARRTLQISETAANLRNLNTELVQNCKDTAEFTYAVSHDLKSPTNTVQMLLKVLKEDHAEEFSDEAHYLIDSAEITMARMSQIIADVLLYSRTIEASPEVKAVDLGELMGTVVGDLSGELQEADAQTRIDNLPVVTGHSSQLRLLFRNLVSNAVKFRAPERQLSLHVGCKVACDGSSVTINVSDNGIGIEPEYHDRIFGLFQRLHTHDVYPGSGIGLSICKRIAGKHKGEISLQSEPGVGSAFSVRLPIGLALGSQA